MANPVFRSSTVAFNNAGASVALSVPAGTVSGDVLLTGVTFEGGTNTTLTPPAGWTLVRRDDSGTTLSQSVYYRVSPGGEPASYTWGFSPAARAALASVCYSGCDQTNPVNAHGGQANGSSGSILAPAATPTVTNCELVGFFGVDSNGTFTVATGMTARATEVPGSAPSPALQAEDQDLTSSGSTGSRTASNSGAAVNVGQLACLAPPQPVVLPPNPLLQNQRSGPGFQSTIPCSCCGGGQNCAACVPPARVTMTVKNISGCECLDGLTCTWATGGIFTARCAYTGGAACGGPPILACLIMTCIIDHYFPPPLAGHPGLFIKCIPNCTQVANIADHPTSFSCRPFQVVFDNVAIQLDENHCSPFYVNSTCKNGVIRVTVTG